MTGPRRPVPVSTVPLGHACELHRPAAIIPKCHSAVPPAARGQRQRVRPAFRCARAIAPPSHRTSRSSLPVRRLRHLDDSRVPERCDRPGSVRAAYHRVSAPPVARPVIPEKCAAEVMSDLFAVRFSMVAIAATGGRTARGFERGLDRVAKIIHTTAPVKHIDEAAIRGGGRTNWRHVLRNALPTVRLRSVGPVGFRTIALPHASRRPLKHGN